MTSDDATLAVIDLFEAEYVPYMVVGSISSNFYGVPRSTQDADIVIQLEVSAVRPLAEKLGGQFRLDPQPTFDPVTMTTSQKLEVIGITYKIEFFHLSDDAHDQERFRRRRRVILGSRQVWLPTAEDVIVTKLRWIQGQRRSKDWDDVQNVIAVQRDKIDWDYVNSWCEHHGTRSTLDEIRQSISPI
jgi:hypothetical protein